MTFGTKLGIVLIASMLFTIFLMHNGMNPLTLFTGGEQVYFTDWIVDGLKDLGFVPDLNRIFKQVGL